MDAVTARFGRRVRQLRIASGFTQEQLGKAAGLDAKHIGVIERGVKASSFNAVARLAKALHVDIHELFLPDTPQKQIIPRAIKPPSFQKASKRDMEQCLEDVLQRVQRLQQ